MKKLATTFWTIYLTISAFAIPGLKVSVRCPDVLLSWPSVEGASYLVYYRPDLNPGTPWQLLSWMAADWGTNVTYYTHVGISACPPASTMPPDSASTTSSKPSLRTRLLSAEALMPPLPPPPPPRWWFTNRSLLSNLTTTTTLVTTNTAGPVASDDPQPGPSPLDAHPPDCGFYQVVMQGANPYTLTNGMVLSGIVTIPVELGELSGEPDYVGLTDNDESVTSAGHAAPFERPVPILVLDTTALSNGVHNLSAFAEFFDADNAIQNYDESPPISVIVSNIVSYPDYIPWFGEIADQLLFTAQVARSNITYRLDIYDSQNNYVSTITNSSTDGTIEALWDLCDQNGTLRTDAVFNFHLTAYSNGLAFLFTTNPPPLYRNTDRWVGPGGWVVVNQRDWDTVYNAQNLQTMANGIAGIATAANLPLNAGARGRTYGSMPLRVFGNPPSVSWEDETNDWYAFKLSVFHPVSRNLYYFGHGDTRGLGRVAGFKAIELNYPEITANLVPWPTLGLTNGHRYRFVFLDSCRSARGPLRDAFGVPKGQRTVQSFILRGLHPSFFAGWKFCCPITDSGGRTIFNPHVAFVQVWTEFWVLGEEVARAFDDASNDYGAQNVRYDKFAKHGAWDLSVYGNNN